MKAMKIMATAACCVFAFAALASEEKPAADSTVDAKSAAKAEKSENLPKVKFVDGWTEDYEGALKLAAASKKPIFLDFTGSDWCGWCMLMDRKVFAKGEWKKWAAKNVVCVKLDFPQSVKQTDALKAQNRRLMDRFGIRGFPTFVVLSPDGEKKLGQFGCPGRGVTPEQFIKTTASAIGK